MLIEFRIKNFKSFADEAVFSMKPAARQREMKYSIYERKIKSRTVRALSSAVIYGPNAAGKTNIIGAIDVLKAIVLRGNIRNEVNKTNPNIAADLLELIPNAFLEKSEPVEFNIIFFEDKYIIEYGLVMQLGEFLDGKSERKIIKETLTVNDNTVFKRSESVELGNLKTISEFIGGGVNLHTQDIKNIIDSGLDKEELFLTNGFKLIVSPKFAAMIVEWFDKKLNVIYRANDIMVLRKEEQMEKRTLYIDKNLDRAVKIFGADSDSIGYGKSEDDAEETLYSAIKKRSGRDMKVIAADLFESYGTVRFANLFPIIAGVLEAGGVLVADEFDASIHPMALMSIINIFHNDDVNINHAQLIFNTHNPIFLNRNLFRRDEIKFVERDESTGVSEIYSLSDFGTSGSNSVRNCADYMKNYFVNRYGAIRDVDFTDVFENVLKKGIKDGE